LFETDCFSLFVRVLLVGSYTTLNRLTLSCVRAVSFVGRLITRALGRPLHLRRFPTLLSRHRAACATSRRFLFSAGYIDERECAGCRLCHTEKRRPRSPAVRVVAESCQHPPLGALHPRTQLGTRPVAAALAFRSGVRECVDLLLSPAGTFGHVSGHDVTDHQGAWVLPAVDVARSVVVNGPAAHGTREA
jgi:hypothetical protein